MPEKVLSGSDVAQMLSEEIINNFHWGVVDKDQAENIRKQVNIGLSRRELANQYKVSVFPVVNSQTEVVHIVSVVKKDIEDDNQTSN